MNVTLELYGTVRDAVGEKRLDRDPKTETTVGDLLRAVGEEYPTLSPLVFDSKGRIRPNIAVTRNGDNIALEEGASTPLDAEDTVVVAPGVAGGSREPNQAATSL
jgi:molybdopterin converting factor small subunit